MKVEWDRINEPDYLVHLLEREEIEKKRTFARKQRNKVKRKGRKAK